MSFHYEVVFSLFLRENTPAEVLDELRYHLGLAPEPPRNPVLDYDFPVLRPNPDSYLPGGEHAALREQLRGFNDEGDLHAWGLHARLFWLDDQWAEVWWQVVQWLAPHVEDNGYAGFVREEADERPAVLTFHNGEFRLDEP
ncbi:hypothetical protein [Lentzea sp. CC55]|uniref:hypothetical protein n=1 Tax=Lentzea sp. CC55 TaxID=2884909 RepID=UPI001F381E5F|nr:hypothetical protein [Lentzea sp. CC55]MCG8921546.1 hypothetical protein [Lentzea sp. CC55]